MADAPRTFGHALRDPVFKGCTRPAMLFGVPMPWMVLSGGAMMIAAPYLLYFVHPLGMVFELLLFAPLYLWMREATRRDDQRLHQLTLRAWMRLRQWRSRQFWSAVSYAPLTFKRRGL